mgnify:CR=1 FL=1
MNIANFTLGRSGAGRDAIAVLYLDAALPEPVRQALTTMDPERRQVLTHQAARALMEDKGVLPVIFLRNTWAGRRDRVVYVTTSTDGKTRPSTPHELVNWQGFLLQIRQRSQFHCQ